MGNLVKDGGGTRDPAKVQFPADLAIGKSWRTDYQNRYDGGSDKAFYNMRVVALEDVEVPAGKYRAYRIEGEGWADGSRGRFRLSDTYWIDPATFVIVKSHWTSRVNGAIISGSNRELRSLRLVARP